MKIERLSQDKIRVFLTFDDLSERGIQKDDLWRAVPKVHELFVEMMDQAYSELGFDADARPLAVEIFNMPAQGMVVIITRSNIDKLTGGFGLDEFDEEDDLFEMDVTLEQSELVCYAFDEFESLLQASKIVNGMLMDGGVLFHYKDRWVLQLEPVELEDAKYNALIAVLSEFGEPSSVTRAVLEDYGKIVIADDAVKVLCSYFQS